MDKSAQPPKQPSGADAKAARLASALRANLRRRKQCGGDAVKDRPAPPADE